MNHTVFLEAALLLMAIMAVPSLVAVLITRRLSARATDILLGFLIAVFSCSAVIVLPRAPGIVIALAIATCFIADLLLNRKKGITDAE